MSIYQQAKGYLKEVAKAVKTAHPTDKPMIRQAINDHCDYLCKNLKLSDYQRDLLSNFAASLHPKK